MMWGYRIGSLDPETYNSIAADPPGNVYQGGTFRRLLDVNPSVITYNINPVGGSDVFYMKWNEMGLFSWARSFGSTNDDTLRASIMNMRGHSFLAGTYAKEMDINPGPAVNKDPFPADRISSFPNWMKMALMCARQQSEAAAATSCGALLLTGMKISTSPATLKAMWISTQAIPPNILWKQKV
ncbi:MAG: hypothetical protein QM743_11085 [Chitinophagaceae bacterium]